MDEIEALRTIDTAFDGVAPEAKERLLAWLNAKYGGSAGQNATPQPSVQSSVHAPAQITNKTMNLSVASICQRTKASGVAEVLMAAAASLTFVQGMESFSYAELATEAAKATGFWTKHHRSNASKAVKTLQAGGKLVELAGGHLCIDPKYVEAFKTKIEIGNG